MKIKKILILLAGFSLAGLHLRASNFDFSGYYALYHLAVIPPVIDYEPASLNQRTQSIAEQHLRLKLAYIPTNNIYAEAAYEFMPFFLEQSQDTANLIPQIDYFCYRLADFKQDLYSREPDRGMLIRHNLDRLFVSVTAGGTAITAGRQPISFGSARIVNPTNVLAPLAYGTIGIEQVIGIDALRVSVPMGQMSEIDTGIVFCEGGFPAKSVYFIRPRLNRFDMDVTLTAMAYHENFLAGLDIVRPIGNAGFWIESAYTMAKALGGGMESENFFRLSTGVDYNFDIGSGLYALLEYHYNGASINQPANYLADINETAYIESGAYLLGRHYLIPRVVYDITPLFGVDFSVLINLTDASAYFITTFDYNVRQNMYIGLGVLTAAGRNSYALPPAAAGETVTVIPRSEFGLYATSIYTYFKVFF